MRGVPPVWIRLLGSWIVRGRGVVCWGWSRRKASDLRGEGSGFVAFNFAKALAVTSKGRLRREWRGDPTSLLYAGTGEGDD